MTNHLLSTFPAADFGVVPLVFGEFLTFIVTFGDTLFTAVFAEDILSCKIRLSRPSDRDPRRDNRQCPAPEPTDKSSPGRPTVGISSSSAS